MSNPIYLIVVISIILFSNDIYSQKEIKYKDVYKYVLEKDTILSYEMLKEFQEQEPFHANTYYQLGLISQYWSNKYDALTQADDVNYFIYHTNVYLNLSKKYLDDKEVRKNREFYQGIKPSGEKKISFEDVINEIDKRLEKNSQSKQNVSSIQNNYIKSVELYNSCVELFLDINKNNSNLKELLLTVDDELLNKINNLGVLYDSTLINLEKFEKGIKNFPIKAYKQQHKINTIETYRLEGLTYSSFLNQEINLWNFKEWVDKFNKTLNSDIKDIRFKIDSTENIIVKSIKELSRDYSFSDSLKQTKVNLKVLFKIGKYDYNSVIVDLFNYQEACLNFIEYAQTTDNNINKTTDLDLKKKSRYYSKLVNKKVYADRLKIPVKLKIVERSTSKYREFVKSNFKNIAGFKKYVVKQSIDNSLNLKKYLNNLKYFMFKSIDENHQDTILKFGKYQVPLNINDSDTLKYKIKTKSLSTDTKGNTYIAGSLKIAKSEKYFIALKNNNKIKWFKLFSNKNSGEGKAIVKANNSGCFAVFSAINNNDVTNKLIRLDKKGIKKTESNLDYKSVIRYLNYDDINEKVLLVFYGNTIYENSINKSDLEVVKFNVEKGNVLEWTTPAKIEFIGNFVDLVKINQNYYVFTNYNEYTDLNNSKVSVKNNSSTSQNNTLLTIINEKGVKTKMINFPSHSFYYLTKVVKINDNLINLMGIYGDINKAKQDIAKEAGNFFYVLIDNKGDVIFK